MLGNSPTIYPKELWNQRKRRKKHRKQRMSELLSVAHRQQILLTVTFWLNEHEKKPACINISLP